MKIEPERAEGAVPESPREDVGKRVEEVRHVHRRFVGRVLVVEDPVPPHGADGEVEEGRAQDEHRSAGGEVGDGVVGDGEAGDGEVEDGEVEEGLVEEGEVGEGEVGEGEVGEGEVGEGEVEAQQRRSVEGEGGVEDRQRTANGAEEVTHGVGGDARQQKIPQTRAAQEVPAASMWMGRSRSSPGRQK